MNLQGMEFGTLRIDLRIITQQQKPAEGESLAAVLKRLDEVARQPDLPSQLEHYLSKRSYVKALAWLDNPEMPHEV